MEFVVCYVAEVYTIADCNTVVDIICLVKSRAKKNCFFRLDIIKAFRKFTFRIFKMMCLVPEFITYIQGFRQAWYTIVNNDNKLPFRVHLFTVISNHSGFNTKVFTFFEDLVCKRPPWSDKQVDAFFIF